jgi:Na+/melibiose symporter-like transporter
MNARFEIPPFFQAIFLALSQLILSLCLNSRNVMPSGNVDEEQPLLHREISEEQDEHEREEVKFSEDDEENPRAWDGRKKLINVAIIALMSILSPLASSMFTPGIEQVAKDLNTDQQSVVATTTGFVIMLGFGPLVIAPLSETFGRRQVYVYCFVVFSLLQIPTALAPNVATLIAVRSISGFFGSKLVQPPSLSIGKIDMLYHRCRHRKRRRYHL